MKKLFSLSVLFLLLFLATPVAWAGAPGFIGICVNTAHIDCRIDIENLVGDCSALQGESKRECITLTNLLITCCVAEFIEEDPGCLNVEKPEESTICEVIEDYFELACDD